MPEHKILIVEDEEAISHVIESILSANHYVPLCARSGGQALALANAVQPDLILLDLGLPDMDGVEVLRRLRQWDQIPILVVSARDQEKQKVEALDLGANDYITKPFGIMELISRVKALLRRSAYVEEKKFLTLGNVFMDDEKHAVYVSDQVCELTYKEYELLKLLMSNAGIVTARDTIMERIWGIDFEGESRTLDMHIKTLRKKLGEAGSMIKTVRNVGYIMSDKEN